MVCWEDATGPRGDAAVPRVYVAIHDASPHAASLSFTPISACAEIRFNVVLSGRVFDHAPLILWPITSLNLGVATGTFLVRQSTSQAGSYALSIKTNHGPRHCQILQVYKYY